MSTAKHNTPSAYFNSTRLDNGFVEIVFSPATSNEDTEQRLTFAHYANFLEVAIHWLTLPEVKGIVYHSGHITLQGELDYASAINEASTATTLGEQLLYITDLQQRLLGIHKPRIGCVHGDAKGLAFAWLLLADQRMAIGDTGVFGFPECAYGLFPGYGMVNRMHQLWGAEAASYMGTQSIAYSYEQAHEMGIIHRCVASIADALLWVNENLQDSAEAPLNKPSLWKEVTRNSSNEKQPGVIACQHIVQQIETRLTPGDLYALETQEFLHVLQSVQVLAQLRTRYYGVRDRTADTIGHTEDSMPSMSRLGVVGAGMMGAGIAYEAARAGMDVMLLDTSQEIADRGKNYAQRLTDKQLEQGKINEREQEALLARIVTGDAYHQLAETDLVIEAVFEDLRLKSSLIAAVSAVQNPHAVLATNTTSLPIATLAHASCRPQNFIGIHFFSPVERMPLVEVIVGAETSASTRQRALQLVHRLKKVPIVVQDGPGFYTSRIFFNYLLEGLTMLLEGVSAAEVEHAAKCAGFPVGPLLVLDEISLPLMQHVYDQFPRLHPAQQSAMRYLKKMIAAGRIGRKAKAGFYQYNDQGRRQEIWTDSELGTPATKQDEKARQDELQNRLLHVVALDSFRCLAEGVLEQPLDGDLGALLGIGYPPHTGGVFSHIDQVGIANFLADCKRFAVHGNQWDVPQQLVELATSDFKFYTGLKSNWPVR